MKVYELFEDFEPKYPDDMKVILNYLESRGKLNVRPKTVEGLYEDFSDDMYCAGWMSVQHRGEANYDLLQQFAEWLSKVDI